MFLKKSWSSALNLYLSLLFSFIFSLTGINVKADMINPNNGGGFQGNVNYQGNYQGQWGSGYWGGVQGCNQNWQQGSGAVSMSDEELEERKNIQSAKLTLAKAQLDKKRADSEMAIARRKLERVFDSDVLEFLVETHMDLLNQCKAYINAPSVSDPSKGTTTCTTVDATGKLTQSTDSAVCGAKTEVPAKLKDKWIGPKLNYCTANSDSSAGNIDSNICSDTTLRPDDAPKYRSYSSSECKKALTDYKKNKIKSDNAQGAIEKMQDEIADRQYAIADAKERAKLEKQYNQANTTETDCPECMAAARNGGGSTKKTRDWVSVLGTVGIGLGLGYLGKKYDDRNAEYNAQLGYPPQQGYPTAVSMGLPFILGGVYGAINGTSGQGGYGCAAGMNGTGGVYGAGNGMNGPFGGAGGVYGPYGNMGGGGAFGYPQGMYGTPWGGGMYNPGYGAGGNIAGPWGGYPGGMGNTGFAVNGGLNGGLAVNGGYPGIGGNGQIMCIQAPCPGGYNMGGFPASGYNMGGIAMSGGVAMNGGYPASGGYNMGGYNMGGFPASGYNMGGIAMSGGVAMNGGYPASGGYNMGGYNMGGFPASGYNMGGIAMSGGVAMNGGYPASGGTNMSSQYQLQMLQMQQQMQQQAMQQQMQYQQAQMQAQMQAYQRQMAVQQQASQVQQEIASLQVRLQMLYSGAYTSNSTYNTGTIPQPTGTGVYPYGTGTGTINTVPYGSVNPTGTGSQVTVPAPNGR